MKAERAYFVLPASVRRPAAVVRTRDRDFGYIDDSTEMQPDFSNSGLDKRALLGHALTDFALL
jgi:hypothetical protein